MSGASNGPAEALVSSAAAIIVTDVRGRVVWVSPSAEEMSGYRPDELLGWPVAELFPGGPDEARAVMRRLAGEERVRGYRTTFPGRAGRRVPVSASMSLLRDGDGTVTGAIGILRDISDHLRAEGAVGRRQVLQPEPLPLTEVIDEMAAMLQRLVGEDITLTLRHGAALWILTVDARRSSSRSSRPRARARGSAWGSRRCTAS